MHAAMMLAEDRDNASLASTSISSSSYYDDTNDI